MLLFPMEGLYTLGCTDIPINHEGNCEWASTGALWIALSQARTVS